MKKFNMNDIDQKVGGLTKLDLHSPSSAPPSNRAIRERLDGYDLDAGKLGVINGWRMRNYNERKNLESAKRVNEEKHQMLVELSVDKLRKEVRLLAEQIKIEFDQQYAALAERRATGQAIALQKFEALAETARDLLWDNRANALSRVEERYEGGFLSYDEFVEEVAYIKQRYQKLRKTVTDIANEMGEQVRHVSRNLD